MFVIVDGQSFLVFEVGTESEKTAVIHSVKELLDFHNFGEFYNRYKILTYIKRYTSCKLSRTSIKITDFEDEDYFHRTEFKLKDNVKISEKDKKLVKRAFDVLHHALRCDYMDDVTDDDYYNLSLLMNYNIIKDTRIIKIKDTNITECLI